MALQEFKARIGQSALELPPALLINGDLDATLLRFLRARKFNVDHAFAMLLSECVFGGIGTLVRLAGLQASKQPSQQHSSLASKPSSSLQCCRQEQESRRAG